MQNTSTQKKKKKKMAIQEPLKVHGCFDLFLIQYILQIPASKMFLVESKTCQTIWPLKEAFYHVYEDIRGF